ncbi:MAG: hypothetical protein JNN12_16000 [Bacteroidetes Order II. Incertae sedis bacterium]|nr:hypothetical protein [Bacteroidetes Order II. bacterium]
MKYLFSIVLLLLVASCSTPKDETLRAREVKQRALADVGLLKSDLSELYRLITATNADTAKIQSAFKSARLHYKAVEYLAEYLIPRVAKRMNGPALQKVEVEAEEITTTNPNGFQVVEEQLFPAYAPEDVVALSNEVAYLRQLTDQLEANLRVSELKDRQVFEAMRLQVVRILSLGISGFDSPVAFYSLPESVASLARMKEALRSYMSDADLKLAANALEAAIDFIKKSPPDFGEFDRATFIREHLTPLSHALLVAQQQLHIPLSTYRAPLKPDFTTVFSEKAFDLAAFAPTDAQKPTPLEAHLGKILFYDPFLAGDGGRSCASCHLNNRAFTDGLPLATSTDGIQDGMRNTPTILNAGLSRSTAYDLTAFTLEDRVEKVLRNPKELHTTPEAVGQKLRTIPEYVALFEKAFPLQDLTDAKMGRMAVRAIASYMRTQTSLNSPIDRYLRGEHVTVSPQVIQGFNLFMGKAKCGTCHFAPLYNGTVPPAYVEAESEVLGVPSKPVTSGAKVSPDIGKFALLQMDVHRHAFKTTTVRNAALTAPYMHNGVYNTLDEVLDFYNRGGGAGIGILLPNQTLPPEPLNLTRAELVALRSFIESLNDTSPITPPVSDFPRIPVGNRFERKR